MGKGKSVKKSGMDNLIAAVRKLEKVKQQARALGIFTDDRELLECPRCGLMEDVTFEGLLVTYLKTCEDMKDCGLRFSAIDIEEGRYRCPACGAETTIPELEE